jgi:D-alanine transaminase
VMAIQEGVVMTAPESSRILSGVTRNAVLELAKKNDLLIEERFVPVDVLYRADEVFLTGTTLEVLGVVRIDGHTIGSGQPGPITNMLAARWALLTG